MTNHPSFSVDNEADRFARRVCARLSPSLDELPYDVSERLRAARVQALARRKVVQIQPFARMRPLPQSGLNAAYEEGLSLWSRLASAVPLVALVVGLVVTVIAQDNDRSVELAEVDAALLTDDLPPEAYADPGFLEYLNAPAQDTLSQ